MLLSSWQDVLRKNRIGVLTSQQVRRSCRDRRLSRSSRRVAQVENLQERCLLSAVAILGDGSVLISDNVGTANDLISLSVEQGNLRISDPANPVSATSGTTQVDTHTVDVPLSSLTGSLFISLAGGNDSVTILDALDVPGDFIEDSDSLTIRADVHALGVMTFSGRVAIGEPLAGDSTLANPVALSATEIRFLSRLDAAQGQTPFATVTGSMLVEFDDVISERQSFDELRVAAPTIDLFVPSNVESVVQGRDATSSTFAGRFGDFGTTTIVNPSSSLRFDLGVGSQRLLLEGLGTDFDADLFIDGDATDFVQIGDEGTGLSVGESRFEVTAGAIEVAGPVGATGDGSVQLTASEWVAVTATGSIMTEDGSVVLSGGVEAVSNPGSQPGVTVDGGTIFTRNGGIQLTGFGGSAPVAREGVRITGGAVVSSSGAGPDAGDVVVSGTSGIGPAGTLIGVLIDERQTLVSAVDASVVISGTGRGNSASPVRGVLVADSAAVASLGDSADAGGISVTGLSQGVNTGTFSIGVELLFGSSLTSSAGDIMVSGTGGAGGGEVNAGVSLRAGSGIVSGSGEITVAGSARSSGPFAVGVLLDDGGRNDGAFIESTSGAILVSGTGSETALPVAAGSQIGIAFGSGDNRVSSIAGDVTLMAIAGVNSTGLVLGFRGLDGVNTLGVAGGSGGISLLTDSLFTGQPLSLRGSGSLLVMPVTAETGIAIGQGSADLRLSSDFLESIEAGFEAVVIGDPLNGTGAVEIRDASFTNPVVISGGTISVSGLEAVAHSVTLTATIGRIVGGDGDGDVDVHASAVRLESLTSSLINGAIGTISRPLRIETESLSTDTSASFSGQFLEAVGSVGVESLNAGSVIITLSGDEFRLNGSESIADSSVINLPEASTLLNLNGFSETLRGLGGSGTVALESGTLSIAADEPSLFGGMLSGSGNLRKTNSGSLILNGASTFSGTTTVLAGALQLASSGALGVGSSLGAGSGAASGTVVEAGARLGIPVSVMTSEQLTINGVLDLNVASAAVSAATGSLELSSSAELHVSVASSEAGLSGAAGGFDQLIVSGHVEIDDALLVLDVSQYPPGPTDGVVLIANDGDDPINGEFRGLPNGTVLSINGVDRAVSYFAGDGNDFGLLPLLQNVSVEIDADGNLRIEDVAVGGSDNAVLVTFDPVSNEFIVTARRPELFIDGGSPSTEVRVASAHPGGAVIAELGAGNDLFVSEVSGRATRLSGGTGDDTLITTNGDDVIDGGSGNDVIDAGPGRDTISGGDGDDRIRSGGGRDSVRSGAGDDVVDGGGSGDVIENESGHDRINGDSGDDVIVAGNGSSTIDGGSGDDLIYGGPQGDVINGGADDDRIFGQGGDDTLRGAAGNDLLDGGDGDDRLRGQGGHDSLAGGRGIDALDGGAGQTALSDVIDGFVELLDDGYRTASGDRADVSDWNGVTLSGGDGDDVLVSRQFTQGSVVLLGGRGNDSLFAGPSDDVLFGGDGDDSLRGGGGRDALFGEAGHDMLLGQGGVDTLSGGAGDDQLDGGASASFLREGRDGRITLSTRDGVPRIAGFGIDSFVGRFAGVILVGGDSGNLIDASAYDGNVTILGGAGSDTIIGTDRADVIDAGAGDDHVSGLGGSDAIHGRSGNDILSGGADDDTLLGGDGDDILRGDGHNDLLLGEAGTDVIDGGTGADVVAGGGNGESSDSDVITVGNRGIIDEAIQFAFAALLSGS